MRKLLIIFLFYYTPFCFSQENEQNSMLWRIKGNGLKDDSYLLGTLHDVCDRDIKLKPKVVKALNSAKTLVFECNYTSYDPYKDQEVKMKLPINVGGINLGVPIYSFQRDLSAYDFLPNNIVLKDIMELEKYEFVNQFFKDSLGVKKGLKPFQRFQPFHAIYSVQYSMKDCPISSYEEVIGHKMVKYIFKYKGLETIDEHANIHSNYKTDKEMTEELYNLTINYKDSKLQSKKNYSELIKQYELENLSYFIASPNEYYDKVYVIDRNINWIPKIKNLVKKTNTVILVGARHLAGENGLIKLLKKEGYIVEPIFD